MKTVIKGAVYKRENDLVIPHQTGEFSIVDCDNYVTIEEYEGVKYYYAEWSPEYVTDDWELLSDISELRLTEINI